MNSEIEIYKIVVNKDKTYFIFNPLYESSLSWPSKVDIIYKDSNSVKLLINKYNSLLEVAMTQNDSTIFLVRDCPDLHLSFTDSKDSLQKSMYYVIILPSSITDIYLPNYIFATRHKVK